MQLFENFLGKWGARQTDTSQSKLTDLLKLLNLSWQSEHAFTISISLTHAHALFMGQPLPPPGLLSDILDTVTNPLPVCYMGFIS